MDRDIQRPLASGLHPVEVAGTETYAWTSPLTTFTFRDLSRRTAWRCIVRFRAARPPGFPQPDVAIAVDGATLATRLGGPHYEDVEVVAPARGARGLRLSVATSPAFVPPTDPRELGVQLDRVACEPESAWVLPPRRTLTAAVTAGAAFGALFGVLGTSILAALASMAFGLAVAQLMQLGFAAFTASYLDRIIALSLWIALPAAAVAWLLAGRASGAARFVVAFSAAVLFLKLAALLHPSKALVDALFHAHRLEWVMDGRYYFTQPMPGGVQFPYAIALYVTALPFASLVTDHVALLRIVVTVFETFAAGVLYVAVARAGRDRLAAALAVVVYHLVPLPYAVIGNANLTYAFGHAVSVLAFAAVVCLAVRWHRVGRMAALLLVTCAAFLSHVAVFPLLMAALVFTGALYATSRDPEVRPLGLPLIVAAVLAAVIAFGVYYAHFPEVYRTLDRVRTTVPEGPAADQPVAAPAALSAPARAVRAVTLGARDVGLPLALLAAAGAWLRIRGRRGRLDLALAGWAGSFLLFVGFRVVAPVDPRLQRYADEFIDRVYYATLPAIVILAGYAAAYGWRARGVWRAVAALTLFVAASIGVRAWADWVS